MYGTETESNDISGHLELKQFSLVPRTNYDTIIPTVVLLKIQTPKIKVTNNFQNAPKISNSGILRVTAISKISNIERSYTLISVFNFSLIKFSVHYAIMA